jgi:hypothetical protein
MQAKFVRFAVNISNTVVAQNDIYMISNFQTLKNLGIDFQSGGIQMVQHPTDTNIYYFSVDLPAFQIYEYQIEKGSTGYEKEWVPVESRSPNDYRWIYLDSLNTDTLKLPEVLFGENNTLTDTMYRFRLDMRDKPVLTSGVRLAGDFQGNLPANSRMCCFAGNDSLFEYMAWLPPNTTQQYKFYNGINGSNGEIVPSSCATNNKRTIANVSVAQVLPVVCFSSCTSCSPLSIENLNIRYQPSLAPNPIHTSALISFNDDESKHQIKLFDMMGRILNRFENITSNTFEIQRENLKPGVYYLNISNGKNQNSNLKLVVE